MFKLKIKYLKKAIIYQSRNLILCLNGIVMMSIVPLSTKVEI